MGGALARMENNVQVLTLAKLANVALSMLWGFAVTYVFVRVLPYGDFRAFVLLVAFNNFTISAEFGLTNIIYARLRRYWLARHNGEGERGDFRLEEIGVLFLFLLSLIGGASILLAGALVSGILPSNMPALFLLFFLASALNVQALLAKRGLAAIDRNMGWESIDLVRRVISLTALFAVLAGFDLMGSVLVQLVTSVIAILWAMGILHRALDMRLDQWLAWRVGGGHVRATYLRDIGASVLLTVSEIGAYNAPYFTIAALSHQPWLLLLFDFVFKMSRAVSTAIRATIEAVLPRLTRAYFAQDSVVFTRQLWRALGGACAVSVCAAALLIALGQRVFAHLFDGRAEIYVRELGLLCVLLVALALICTSVYVQGALGRFSILLRQSLPFLAGSLLLMPLTIWVAGTSGRMTEGGAFMLIYAACFTLVALLHALSLRALVRHVGAGR